MPTGSSIGENTVRASTSQPTRNIAPKSADAGSTTAMVGADDEPHQMRHDDADERHRPAERDGRAGGERRAQERDAFGAPHVDAARGRRVAAEAHEVERARERRHRDARDGEQRQRAENRRVAADVERSHQPAHRPERVGEARQVLHEQHERREERVQRDAGEQQARGRHAAAPRRRERVDDDQGADRAGEAGERHRRDAEDGEARRER